MDEILVTPDEYEKLRQQLQAREKDLDDARRRIGEAAKYGDLSENSEYDAAREDEQLFLAMVMQLRSKLSRCQIMTQPVISKAGEAVIGSQVRVQDLDQNQEVVYTIVGGGGDFDFLKGEIPYNSPLGLGLQGHKAGDLVEVVVGAGTRRLKILQVS